MLCSFQGFPLLPLLLFPILLAFCLFSLYNNKIKIHYRNVCNKVRFLNVIRLVLT